MEANKQAELLKDEYIMLQNLYEDMDNKGLTIKNWAITVALAIIGVAILQNEKVLVWLAAGASLVFWYLEAHWRGLSYFFVVRIKIIEAAIQNGTWEKELPLQFYSTWEKEYQKSKDQTWKYMFKQETLLPHILIPIIAALLYFLLP